MLCYYVIMLLLCLLVLVYVPALVLEVEMCGIDFFYFGSVFAKKLGFG